MSNMKLLSELQSKKERYGIGVLSGTSIDGVDVGLVKLRGKGNELQVRLVNFETYPISNLIRSKILKNCHKDTATLPELSQLNFLIGELFAEKIRLFINKHCPKRVDFIASHGQTVWHNPIREKIGKFSVGSTFQLGEGALIAHRLGILTISNFRAAEFPFGKDGAPLVPYLDFIFFRHPTKHRLLINIGGISNVTALKSNTKKNEVVYFDSGAGNVLIDKATMHFFGLPFDRGGKLASKGNVNQKALKILLKEPYYAKVPPKSTGRELFSNDYFNNALNLMKNDSPCDVVATLTTLTVESIYDQYMKFISPLFDVHEVIVSGGGAQNQYLMRRLNERFSFANVVLQDNLHRQDYLHHQTSSSAVQGIIPAKAKESVLFAVLGNELLFGNSASMQTPALLGSIHLPPIFPA